MKRLTDIVFSILGLSLLWPVGLLVAAGVKICSPGPVFFRQERLGRQGSTFQIYKFRTMTVQEPGSGCPVTAGGDPRVTAFGSLLRRSKLDEWPQLINVLRGEMAFVGPRPEVPEFAELYPMEYARILKVRPGITHPATLSFRREEEILAGAGDPREFYIDRVLPEKLAAYEARLEQSLAQDIRTIVETIVPYMGADPHGPDHFASPPAQKTRATARVEAPTVVANIPAFAAEPGIRDQRAGQTASVAADIEEAVAVGT